MSAPTKTGHVPRLGHWKAQMSHLRDTNVTGGDTFQRKL